MKGLRFILSCMATLSLLVACDATSGVQSSKTAASLLALSQMQKDDQGAKLPAVLLNDVFSADTLTANVFSHNIFTGIISGSTVDLTTLTKDLLTKGRVLIHVEPGLSVYLSVNVVSWYGVKFEFIFDNYWAHDVTAPLETCSGTLVTTAGTSGGNFILTLNGTLTFKNTTISIDPVTVCFKDIRIGFDVLDGILTQSSILIWDGNVEVDGRGITLDAIRLAAAALNALTKLL